MKVKIRAIRDPGVPEKERLVLEVVQDDDIGHYAVFHTRVTGPGRVSSRIQKAYWFPDKQVRSGDVVSLYTKKGRDNERRNADDSTSHFFYWNLDAPLWVDKNVTAVLASLQWEIASRTEEALQRAEGG